MCFGSKGGSTAPPPATPATTFETIKRDDPSQRQMVWQGTPGTSENKVSYGTFGSELAGDPNAPAVG